MAADSELFNRTKCSVAVQRLYRVTDNNSINVHRISLRKLAFGSLPSYIYIYIYIHMLHIMEKSDVEKGGQVWLSIMKGFELCSPTDHNHCNNWELR